MMGNKYLLLEDFQKQFHSLKELLGGKSNCLYRDKLICSLNKCYAVVYDLISNDTPDFSKTVDRNYLLTYLEIHMY